MDQITFAIRALTAHVIAYRFQLERKRMSHLSEKVQLAAGVAPRQALKIEARADALIARESRIETLTDQAFSPHEEILTDAESSLNNLESALAPLSNGGPPLPPSMPSPVVIPGADQGTAPARDVLHE